MLCTRCMSTRSMMSKMSATWMSALEMQWSTSISSSQGFLKVNIISTYIKMIDWNIIAHTIRYYPKWYFPPPRAQWKETSNKQDSISLFSLLVPSCLLLIQCSHSFFSAIRMWYGICFFWFPFFVVFNFAILWNPNDISINLNLARIRETIRKSP